MNKIKITLSILLLFCSVAFSYAQNKPGKAIIKTTIFCDHCKNRETCGQNFQSNMLKVQGVKMYDLDEKAMTITVYFNPKKTNLETIKTSISKMGYDADDVKAEPIAYEKLDDCCKKV